ncbi:hypothetical protein [Flavobacterium eburneipallidum]|uniref:hypothetical protein n=1 Tax=Flavobacterium eburneipallidum TaxID=3003263 RepID=UPI0022AC375E|nr:hypothetical protein [Flavobacterium eburneipallidum]
MADLKQIENIIRDKSKTIAEDFSQISLNGFKKEFSFEIDVKKLDSKYLDRVDITKDGDFSKNFQEIMEYEQFPALYFFEINEIIEKSEIVTLIKNVNEKFQLNIPAKNNTLNNGGILYVGKVKSCAWGRLIQHLGYHKNRKSHGLQLDYWAKEIKTELKLKYTVIFFEKNIADDISILERILAKSLNPIIGKH